MAYNITRRIAPRRGVPGRVISRLARHGGVDSRGPSQTARLRLSPAGRSWRGCPPRRGAAGPPVQEGQPRPQGAGNSNQNRKRLHLVSTTPPFAECRGSSPALERRSPVSRTSRPENRDGALPFEGCFARTAAARAGLAGRLSLARLCTPCTSFQALILLGHPCIRLATTRTCRGSPTRTKVQILSLRVGRTSVRRSGCTSNFSTASCPTKISQGVNFWVAPLEKVYCHPSQARFGPESGPANARP